MVGAIQLQLNMLQEICKYVYTVDSSWTYMGLNHLGVEWCYILSSTTFAFYSVEFMSCQLRFVMPVLVAVYASISCRGQRPGSESQRTCSFWKNERTRKEASVNLDTKLRYLYPVYSSNANYCSLARRIRTSVSRGRWKYKVSWLATLKLDRIESARLLKLKFENGRRTRTVW